MGARSCRPSGAPQSHETKLCRRCSLGESGAHQSIGMVGGCKSAVEGENDEGDGGPGCVGT